MAARTILTFVGALTAVLCSMPAHSNERSTPTYQWVDERGDFAKIQAAFHTEWIWKKADRPQPGSPAETPALRIWIDSPTDALNDLKPHEASLAPANPGPPPFEPKGKVYVVEALPEEISAGLTFSMKVGTETRTRTLSLVALSESEEPTQLVHPACGQLGIRFQEKIQPGFTYTSLSCEETGDRIRLFWQHSPEIQVAGGAIGEPAGKGKNWQAFVVTKAKLDRKKSLGALALVFKRGGKGHAEVLYEAPEKKRFAFVPGASFSFIRYSEPSNGIDLSELGVTAKMTATYSLIPGKLSADLTGYLTLLPITLSPTGLSPARFFGLNGRAGYRLPLKNQAFQIQGVLGYYIWGMWTSASYGVNYLLGPQFQITLRYQKPVSRAYFGYLKYAPLATSLTSLSLSNNELAAGAGFQLSSPAAKRDWNLTGDFSWTYFVFPDGLNSLRLITFSIGIQTVFN